MKRLCIYHGNCADGFAAAYAMQVAFDPSTIEFHAGVYGDEPPDVTNRHVYLVDFSYKRDVLIEMAAKAVSILILDHHQSAEAELVDLPGNVETVFDMTRSGAVITWDYFLPALKIPPLFFHIMDRDLWRFKLPATREIMACLSSYPYDFDVWSDLMDFDMEFLRRGGESINRKQLKDINELIEANAHRIVIAGHDVPGLNGPYMWASDACHIMAKGEPFAACYCDTGEGRVFQLRSADGGMNVAEIAKLFGGGGHEHAAGFSVPHHTGLIFIEPPIESTEILGETNVT